MLARRGVIEFLLVALCVSCYWGSLRGPWLLDDFVLIARNPMVQRIEWWPRIWVSDYWESAGVQTGLYRPLPVASYAVTHALAGGNTLPYHATNIVLHILASLLVWAVLLRGRRDALALGAAALFAAHPVHAEAVANVVGRSELLLASGFLVALAAHRGLAADGHFSRRRRAAWTAAEFAGAATMLFSKETGVALLLTFLVEDSGTGRLADRAARRRLAPGYVALAVAAALYALLRSAAVTGVMIGPHIESVRARLALTATAALKNAQMLVLPMDQRAVWSHPPLDAVPGWAIAVGLTLIAALALATVAAAHRATQLRLALALIFVSSLLLLHPVPNTAWIWERGLYVPSIGLVWALHAMGESLAPRRGRSLAAAALFIVAAAFSAQTWRMSRVFSSESRFWTHQAAMDPGDTAALVSLSEVRLRAGDRAAAAELRARAYELEPSRAPVVAAHAALLLELGDSVRARDVLTSAAAARLEFHSREQAVMLLRSLEQLSRRADAPRAAADFAGQAVRKARGGAPAQE